MNQAIIFDCDGTLVDSEVLGQEILVEVLAEYGVVVPLTDELVARFRGRKLHDCLAEIRAETGRPLPEEEFIPRFRKRMRSFHCACARSMARSIWFDRCISNSVSLPAVRARRSS
jgi:beta-phosphoglucomutase-like phosphatase (HAD superfamily)